MKLSPEEIAHRRSEHAKKANNNIQLIKKMFDIKGINNPTFKKLFLEYKKSFPSVCEHEKSMVESCLACDEIFKQVFPENCFKCDLCQSLFVNEDEVNEGGICFECEYNTL